MVWMALDHARDFFGDIRLTPENLATTTGPLFATRWITHFCAPTFVLLAGVSAWLYGRKHSRRELSHFLWTRGLWLVVLEFTVVNFGWLFTFDLNLWFFQVIVTIGLAMITLAGFVWLPRAATLAFGALLIAAHNLLDPVAVGELGDLAGIGRLLRWGGPVQGPWGSLFFVFYPVLPWVGVILLGFGLGPVLDRPPEERRHTLVVAGSAAVLGLVLLRSMGSYGDPVPFAAQDDATRTVIAFLNCSKYPPSLLFLLMTLGPALILLAVLDRKPGPLGRTLVVYGRVPLFFYVAHVYLIHGIALLATWIQTGTPYSPMVAAMTGSFPDGFGNGLGAVYLGWAFVVLALYPACRWYGEKKRQGRSPVWSYL